MAHCLAIAQAFDNRFERSPVAWYSALRRLALGAAPLGGVVGAGQGGSMVEMNRVRFGAMPGGANPAVSDFGTRPPLGTAASARRSMPLLGRDRSTRRFLGPQPHR